MSFDSVWPGRPARYWGRHRRTNFLMRMASPLSRRRTTPRRPGTVPSGRREDDVASTDGSTRQKASERVLYLAWSADNPVQHNPRRSADAALPRTGTGRR